MDDKTMICINCSSSMVERDHDLYECPVCGDVLDLTYPSAAEFEAWKAEMPSPEKQAKMDELRRLLKQQLIGIRGHREILTELKHLNQPDKKHETKQTPHEPTNASEGR